MRNGKVTITYIYAFLVSVMLVFMFNNGDPYFNINEYRNLLFLCVIYGVVLIFFQYSQALFTNKPIVIFVVWCISSLLISKYVLNLPAEPYFALFIAVLYLHLLCMGLLPFSKIEAKMLINAFILSSVIISIIILIQHRTPYSGYGIFRLALYYSANEYYDVNFTSMYLMIPTLFSFKIATKSTRRYKTAYLLATIINMLTILLLGSRGTFAPVLAIIVFELLKDKKVSMSRTLIIIVGIFAVVFLIPQDIFNRLLGQAYINPESKRLIDWSYGVKAIQNAPLFGNGLLSAKKIVDSIAQYSWYTIHNTYLVYPAQLGFIGALPFFLILIYPLKKLWVGKKKSFIWLSYVGILFAATMIESNYSYVLIVPLSVFYMLINYRNRFGVEDSFSDIFDLTI